MEFSVVVPAYNPGAFLPLVIQSIRNQNHLAEIILIDDGSTDETHKVAALVDIYYKNPRTMGLSYSRNLGLSLAKGDYICFIDADDIVVEGAFDHHHYWLQNTGVIGVGGCLKGMIDEQGQVLKTCEIKDFAPYILEPQHIYPRGEVKPMIWQYAFRRDLLISGKFQFDSKFSHSEDQAFLLQICRSETIKVAPYYTTWYRCHRNNRSGSWDHESQQFVLNRDAKMQMFLLSAGQGSTPVLTSDI